VTVHVSPLHARRRRGICVPPPRSLSVGAAGEPGSCDAAALRELASLPNFTSLNLGMYGFSMTLSPVHSLCTMPACGGWQVCVYAPPLIHSKTLFLPEP